MWLDSFDDVFFYYEGMFYSDLHDWFQDAIASHDTDNSNFGLHSLSKIKSDGGRETAITE